MQLSKGSLMYLMYSLSSTLFSLVPLYVTFVKIYEVTFSTKIWTQSEWANIYQKVMSIYACYYLGNQVLLKISQYKSIKFPLHKQSVKPGIWL